MQRRISAEPSRSDCRVATWFGIAHAVAFMVAIFRRRSSPWALAEVLPAAMVLGGLILVALLYFAVADFLYVGRLAAFVFVAELPEACNRQSQPSSIQKTTSSATFPACSQTDRSLKPRTRPRNNKLVNQEVVKKGTWRDGRASLNASLHFPAI